MAQFDKAGLKAQGDTLFNDNTNEEITPGRERIQNDNVADSLVFLNDTATITAIHDFSTFPTIPSNPTANEHPVSLGYFNANATPAGGDVSGGASSIVNELACYSDTTGKLLKAGSGVLLDQSGNFSSVGNIGFSTGTRTLFGIQVQNLLDKTTNQTISALYTYSDNITTIAPTTDLHVATKKYVDDNSGAGDVVKIGTPVNNQLGIWTGDGTIEGDANLTWDGSTFAIGGGLSPDSLTVDNIIINGNDISTSSGDLTFSPFVNVDFQSNNLTNIGVLNLGVPSELTIAVGVITATTSYHRVDTESNAATDDLDTINGGTEGDMLIIRATSSIRTIVVTENGNIRLNGTSFSLNNSQDTLTLLFDDVNWIELSRSDNTG